MKVLFAVTDLVDYAPTPQGSFLLCREHPGPSDLLYNIIIRD